MIKEGSLSFDTPFYTNIVNGTADGFYETLAYRLIDAMIAKAILPDLKGVPDTESNTVFILEGTLYSIFKSYVESKKWQINGSLSVVKLDNKIFITDSDGFAYFFVRNNNDVYVKGVIGWFFPNAENK